MDVRAVDSSYFNVTQRLSTTWQFECHVYALAIIWFGIALYSFIVALNLRSLAPCKGLLCRICILLCAAGILRAVYLILDPYESKNRVHLWISRLLYILPWPIFTSGFIFVFLTLLHLTKINMYPYVLQNVKLLTTTMFAFTAIMVAFEIVNQYYTAVLPCYACVVAAFSCWTTAVCVAYFFYGALMLRSLTSAGDPTALRYCKYRKSKYARNCNVVSTGDSLEPPKIKITDENECTYSYRSETASPAVSEASDPSDSADERDVGEDNADESPGGPTVNTNGGKQKRQNWMRRKKDKKPAGKKRKRIGGSKSRSARLRMLVKILFLPAVLCLFSCVWLLWETYYIFLCHRINKWEWFTVVSLSR